MTVDGVMLFCLTVNVKNKGYAFDFYRIIQYTDF